MERRELEAWAKEAGALALAIFREGPRTTARRKADRSWVTDADERAEALLRKRIAAAYPHDLIIGEEQGGSIDSGRVWALDPVDGTGAFVAGLPTWGVSIGLLEGGHPIAGCFYMPVLDECYVAGTEGPAFFNDQQITAGADPNDREGWMAVPSNAHRRYRITYPGKTRMLGSIAAHICYVACGSAVAALVGKAALWDVAGAGAVLERAGGGVWGLSGAPLAYGTFRGGALAHEPLLATVPDLRDIMLGYIRDKQQGGGVS